MSRPDSPRPVGLIVASASSLALAVFFIAMAVLSLSSGHGSFSRGVAVALTLWALLVGGAGALLWARRGWVRGWVMAAGLIHTLAFGQFALNTPWAVLGAVAGLAAAVGAALPSTRAAFSRDR